MGSDFAPTFAVEYDARRGWCVAVQYAADRWALLSRAADADGPFYETREEALRIWAPLADVDFRFVRSPFDPEQGDWQYSLFANMGIARGAWAWTGPFASYADAIGDACQALEVAS